MGKYLPIEWCPQGGVVYTDNRKLRGGMVIKGIGFERQVGVSIGGDQSGRRVIEAVLVGVFVGVNLFSARNDYSP
jgi:hypothetical protein